MTTAPDLDPELSPAAGSVVRRGRDVSPTLVLRVAVVLVAVQTLIRGWTCLRGWFYLDDFAFMARATGHGLFDLAYLDHTYNSHVMPGAWVWVWLTTRAFPMQWAPVAIAMIALQLLLAILVLRLLVALFGPRPLILPALAIALLSPISLPAALWWAAALNQLPQQMALVCALLALVRYMRGGGRRAALAGPLAMALGLLFSEKTLLVLPLVMGVTVAFFTTGGVGTRLRRTARRDRLMWLGYAVVATPYLVMYLVAVPTPLRDTHVPGHDVFDLVLTSVFRATVPGLVGGPLQWQPIGYAGALADPSSFVMALALLVLAAVVTLTIAFRRRASWAWLILAAYSGLNIAVLARSRAVLVGPIAATEYRYQTDVALVGSLMLACATMCFAGRFRRGEVDATDERREFRALVDDRIVMPLRALGGLPSADPAALASVLAAGTVAMMAALSTHAYDPYWVNNPARPWVTTVRSELDGLPSGTRLADFFVPQQVAWGLLYPYNEAYRTLSPVLTPGQVLTPGTSAQRVVVPDDAGHLRLALPGGGRAASGPTKGCGWRISTRSVTVPVPSSLPNPASLVRVGVAAASPTSLDVSINGRSTRVRLSKGLNVAFLQVVAPFSEVRLSVTDAGVKVCTNDVSVGPAVAVPGTAP